MRQWVGSILFTLYLFVSVPIYGAVALLTAPLPRRVHVRRRASRGSTRCSGCCACCADSTIVVEGREHLPARNCVVLLQALVGVGDDRAAQDLSARRPGC